MEVLKLEISEETKSILMQFKLPKARLEGLQRSTNLGSLPSSSFERKSAQSDKGSKGYRVLASKGCNLQDDTDSLRETLEDLDFVLVAFFTDDKAEGSNVKLQFVFKRLSEVNGEVEAAFRGRRPAIDRLYDALTAESVWRMAAYVNPGHKMSVNLTDPRPFTSPKKNPDGTFAGEVRNNWRTSIAAMRVRDDHLEAVL